MKRKSERERRKLWILNMEHHDMFKVMDEGNEIEVEDIDLSYGYVKLNTLILKILKVKHNHGRSFHNKKNVRLQRS